jgi:hypothetical protein
MDKELGNAGKVATADVSSGFDGFKEAVYNFLANLFSWLSTHQGLALIIILIVLAIILYLFLQSRKLSKQIEKIKAGHKTEIGKKEALIEEQKNKLDALQKKLSDQQTVASEAMLKTITTMTGYNIEQLQTFFKFLTGISGNPLQIAAAQASPATGNRQIEPGGEDAAQENEKEVKMAPLALPQEVEQPAQNGAAESSVEEKISENGDSNEDKKSSVEEKLSAEDKSGTDEQSSDDEKFKEDEKVKADEKLSKDEI